MSDENHKIGNTRQKKKELSDKLALLEKEIANLTQKKNEIKEEIDTDYHSFQDEVFGDGDNKKEDGELSILGDVKDTQTKVNKYYNEIFGEDGVKKKISNFQIKSNEINDALIQVEDDSNALFDKIKLHKINADAESENIKSQSKKADELLEGIEEDKDTINEFCSKIDDRETKMKQQNEDIAKSQNELNRSNEESARLLQELTDKSLHNAFKKQAEEQKIEHKKYFKYTILSLVSGIAVLLGMQIGSHIWWHFDNFEMWFTRFVVFIPVSFIYYLCVSNSNNNRKNAEEYQHKASISEALSGYRKLWDLEHDSKEYKDFFNPTVAHLIKNPSDKEPFAQKDILDKIADIVKPVIKSEDS